MPRILHQFHWYPNLVKKKYGSLLPKDYWLQAHTYRLYWRREQYFVPISSRDVSPTKGCITAVSIQSKQQHLKQILKPLSASITRNDTAEYWDLKQMEYQYLNIFLALNSLLFLKFSQTSRWRGCLNVQATNVFALQMKIWNQRWYLLEIPCICYYKSLPGTTVVMTSHRHSGILEKSCNCKLILCKENTAVLS